MTEKLSCQVIIYSLGLGKKSDSPENPYSLKDCRGLFFLNQVLHISNASPNVTASCHYVTQVLFEHKIPFYAINIKNNLSTWAEVIKKIPTNKYQVGDHINVPQIFNIPRNKYCGGLNDFCQAVQEGKLKEFLYLKQKAKINLVNIKKVVKKVVATPDSTDAIEVEETKKIAPQLQPQVIRKPSPQTIVRPILTKARPIKTKEEPKPVETQLERPPQPKPRLLRTKPLIGHREIAQSTPQLPLVSEPPKFVKPQLRKDPQISLETPKTLPRAVTKPTAAPSSTPSETCLDPKLSIAPKIHRRRTTMSSNLLNRFKNVIPDQPDQPLAPVKTENKDKFNFKRFPSSTQLRRKNTSASMDLTRLIPLGIRQILVDWASKDKLISVIYIAF